MWITMSPIAAKITLLNMQVKVEEREGVRGRIKNVHSVEPFFLENVNF